MPDQKLSWRSDESINGFHLLAEFALGTGERRTAVEARFFHSGAPDDSIWRGISMSGTPLRVEHVFRNSLELKGDFRVIPFHDRPGHSSIGVWGNLMFGWPHTISKIHFEGIMTAFGGNGPQPEPIAPDGPEPAFVEPEAAEDSFPYVFLRRWSRICMPGCEHRFLEYVPLAASANTLYNLLVQANPHTWDNMQNITGQYLSGNLATAYPAIPSMRALTGAIERFHLVYDAFRKGTAEGPREKVLEVLGLTAEQLTDYLTSAGYIQEKERCWQTYFALVIKLGCRPEEAEELAATLLAAALIEALYLPPAGSPPAAGDGDKDPRLPAAIVLPGGVFPLPSPGSSPPSGSGTASPFAIGEMQVLRHRVIRYQPGDLARVVNVMPGERRGRTHRRLNRVEETGGENISSSTANLAGSDADLSQAFQKALRTVAADSVNIAYNGFQVSYPNPATASLSGGWGQQIQPGPSPSEGDLQRVAYQLLDRSRAQVTRQVQRLRVEKLLRETEEIQTSVVNNTSGAESLIGVYRWLNRVYSATVFHSGTRMMVCFRIPQPAASFIAAEQRNGGTSLQRPQSPAERNIDGFEQINILNYGALLAAYGVTKDLNPPQRLKVASATLRPAEAKELIVPDGYDAQRAFVTVAAGSTAFGPVSVLVGRESFVFTSASTSSQDMAFEDRTIPLAMVGAEPIASEPVGSPPSLPLPTEVIATVEVECQASLNTMRIWQMAVYKAIAEGYQKQLAEYRDNVGASGSQAGEEGRNPQALAAIERAELRRQCVGVMQSLNLEAYAFGPLSSPAAPDWSPPAREVEDFALVDRGFFEECFDWREMSYYFSASGSAQSPPGAAGFDAPFEPGASFAQFLQASSAMVLVPARQERALATLYFLRSGMVWFGTDRLAPVNPGDQSLVCDLLRASQNRQAPEPAGKSWEVVVPTSEQIVAGRSSLVSAAKPMKGIPSNG